MGSKIGKISAIKKDYSNTGLQTMQGSLSQKNMTRVPGTGVFKYPYKEVSGTYRTGLDPNASYIRRISDPTERDVERERVRKLREKLEKELNINLDPKSSFWNYALSTSTEDTAHVAPVKLMDGDNYFDLNDPMQELMFSWLRVHPTIASSYEAWERGDYPADTQFYVADEDIENAIAFKKNQLINKAIAKFDAMSPEKKKKVARLLGIPVSDSSTEQFVYNQVDKILKSGEFKTGPLQGHSTVDKFMSFADMKDNLLHIKDLVEQATQHSIYRVKPNGKIYEGELEVAIDREELVKHLADEDNQDELLALESKLKTKKLAAV